MQELTTDCANQLRSSRTEYDSSMKPNICQFVAIRVIRGLCGIGVLYIYEHDSGTHTTKRGQTHHAYYKTGTNMNSRASRRVKSKRNSACTTNFANSESSVDPIFHSVKIAK